MQLYMNNYILTILGLSYTYTLCKEYRVKGRLFEKIRKYNAWQIALNIRKEARKTNESTKQIFSYDIIVKGVCQRD